MPPLTCSGGLISLFGLRLVFFFDLRVYRRADLVDAEAGRFLARWILDEGLQESRRLGHTRCQQVRVLHGPRQHGDGPGMEEEAVLVPDIERGPDDRAGKSDAYVCSARRQESHHPGGESCVAGVEAGRGLGADRRSGN